MTLRFSCYLIWVVLLQYDNNSCGPPPPTSVLVMNLSPLTPNQHIRRHFSSYGTISSFEPHINKATGAALGIVFIRFSSNDEAKRCMDREHGKKGATGMGNEVHIVEGEELKVVLDGEGKKLAAVLKELDAQKRREEKERKRKEEEKRKLEAATVGTGSRNTPSTSSGQTPLSNGPWRAGSHLQGQSSRPQPPYQPASFNRPNGVVKHPLPPIPSPTVTANAQHHSSTDPTHGPAQVRRPPPNAVRGRMFPSSLARSYAPRPLPASHSSSSTPLHGRDRPHPAYRRFDPDDEDSPRLGSRSPSPVSKRLVGLGRSAKQREHEAVVEELAKNGFDYVTLEGHGSQIGGSVRSDDVKFFFKDFDVDKVCYPLRSVSFK